VKFISVLVSLEFKNEFKGDFERIGFDGFFQRVKTKAETVDAACDLAFEYAVNGISNGLNLDFSEKFECAFEDIDVFDTEIDLDVLGRAETGRVFW
jgi:hypothetical protein